MAKSTDAVEEVADLRDDGRIKKRRFDARDWSFVADFVIEEYYRRKRVRGDREKQWEEIDRQIEMKPDIGFKLLPGGEIDKFKAWMAEMELPLQAQALEVLTADSHKMMFPDSGPWFTAQAEMTDEYLQSVDFKSLIHGDNMEVPSKINQDNANKLVESFLMENFRQYDLPARVDRINAEAFKYGIGVGRGRIEAKTIITDEAKGSFKEQKRVPVLHPCSIKNTYLDDIMPTTHSAQMLSPAHISVDYMKLENLQIAINKGSSDPNDSDGGWMRKAWADIVADKNGYVTVLEMEGDIVVPRKTTRSFVLHGAIATVVLGSNDKDGKVTKGVVRFRWRKTPFSSYILFPYHYEGAHDVYPTGPLMKGRPLQMMATDALNRLMDSAALKTQPPVGYNKDDMTFAGSGGPRIYPGAQWETIDNLKVYAEVGGDPAALANILQLSVQMYAELTGVLPSRLGAQTLSHTTAYAKDAELQRGATRTVDYVTQSGQGPLTRWLDMSYQMALATLSPQESVSFFIPAYGGYVDVKKKMLPAKAQFQWFGAGGPAELQQRTQVKMSALQLGLKMDQLAVSMGKPPTVNVPAAIREVLREGGWTDLDQITQLPPPPQQLALAPPGGAGAPSGAPAPAIPLAVAEAVRQLHQPGGGLPPT